MLKNLKLLRVKHGMTQEEFAKTIGYSRSHYRLIESGNAEGSLAFWKKIREEFGIPDAEMFELMKDEPKK